MKMKETGEYVPDKNEDWPDMDDLNLLIYIRAQCYRKLGKYEKARVDYSTLFKDIFH